MSTIHDHPSAITDSSAKPPIEDRFPFEFQEIDSSISARFERVVDRFGDRLAVKDDACSYTFGKLSDLADRIAVAVQASGARARGPVALLMAHGAPLVAALSGILKAGRMYLPLDASHPPGRVRAIIRDAQARVLVADSRHLDLARSLAGPKAAVVHFEDAVAIDVPARPPSPAGPDDPAALFYTSGSTGQPKGVLHTQRSLLHTAWRIIARTDLRATDRSALLHSAAAVTATGITLRSLLTGGAVLPFDVKQHGLAALARWMDRQRISFLQIVPTLFRHLIRAGGDQTFPEVRILWLGGETVTLTDVALFRRHFGPHCVFINNLGTTETGSFLQYHVRHDAQLPAATLPVGFPYDDLIVSILDEHGNVLPTGAVGEIAVQSRFLGEYWRRPDLTSERFRPCPGGQGERLYLTGDLGRVRPDGAVEHLGRKDTQIKLRGNRVEVAEVEARLLELPEVSEAAVVVSEDADAEKQLVAHVTTNGRDAPSPELLRRHLAAVLPGYMVPALFVSHDALPLLPGGKVDRQTLARHRYELRSPSAPADAPPDPIRLELTRIWEEVFGFAPIAPTDNFFDLGGHSLLAARLLDRVEQIFARQLPLTVLVEAPTIERLAAVLRDPSTTECPTLIPLRAHGSRPPWFLIPPAHGTVLNFVTLVRHLGEDQPVYGLQPRGFDGKQPAHQSVEEMAIHYLAAMREAHPSGPYFLAGRCFGGVVAFEMAQQLQALGEHVGLLAVLDTVRAPGWALKQNIVPTRRRPLRNPWKRLAAFCRRRRIAGPLAGIARAAGRMMPERHQPQAPPRPPTHSTAEAVLQLKRAHRRAHRLYVPRVYPGHIVLFLASHSSRRERRWQAGWAALTAEGLTEHTLQGDHFSVTKEPLALEVARRLRAAMDDALCHASAAVK